MVNPITMRKTDTIKTSTVITTSEGQFLLHPFVKHTGFYYIEAYLNICYYTCYIPFRIRYNSLKDQYEVREYGFQKILCIFFHLLYLLNCLFCHGNKFINHKSYADDSLQFFTVAETLIELNFAFVLTYMVFCKLNKFNILLALLQSRYTIPSAKMSQKVFIMIGMYVLFWGFGTLIQIQEMTESQKGIANVVIKLSFDWSVWPPPSDRSEDMNKEKLLAPFGTVVQLILHFFLSYGRCASETFSVLFFAFGIYLRDLCEEIRLSIASQRKPPMEILESYLHIKEINRCMDNMCGILFFFYVVGSMAFFALIIKNLGNYNLYFVLRTINMMSYFFVSMISSASANAKADSLKDELLRWRTKDNTAHKREDFMVLQIELSTSNSIGLKGLNFFTATYQFLGVMISQCFVYALLFLQFQYRSEKKH